MCKEKFGSLRFAGRGRPGSIDHTLKTNGGDSLPSGCFDLSDGLQAYWESPGIRFSLMRLVLAGIKWPS